MQLKSLQQLLAASEADIDIRYFTFGREEFAKDLRKLYEQLQEAKVTVGQLFSVVMDYSTVGKRNGLFNYIREHLLHLPIEEEEDDEDDDSKEEPAKQKSIRKKETEK